MREGAAGLAGPARQGRVAVVGSLNVDLVFAAARRPRAGETLRGTAFDVYTGGKGANQALAAARAGGLVALVGRTGDDPFGAQLRAALEADGVDLRHTGVDAGAGTGVAGIVVEPDGSNSIVVVSRANGRLGPSDVARAAGAIQEAAVLLLQLETPLAAAVAAARLAREAGRTVVLNPAPAPPPAAGTEAELFTDLLRLTDIVVPNETEARQLTGIAADTPAGAVRAGRALLEGGPRAALITLGDRGAVLIEAGREDVALPPFDVHVVDTTAAGDAFCGALAVALAEGQGLPLAARFAAAAGALAVTVAGAGPSLPRRQEIERLSAGPG